MSRMTHARSVRRNWRRLGHDAARSAPCASAAAVILAWMVSGVSASSVSITNPVAASTQKTRPSATTGGAGSGRSLPCQPGRACSGSTGSIVGTASSPQGQSSQAAASTASTVATHPSTAYDMV